MKTYPTNEIKNVVLLGASGAGKTTLAEAMAFDGKVLFELLSKIKNQNASGEFYLTDAIEIARNEGLKCSVVETSAEEVAGANTQEELAQLEEYFRKRQAV